MHEYLIEKINQITGKVMDATQRANRLFRQYLSSYSVDKGTRIPIRDLWRIRRYSDVAAGEHERELLRKSLRWGLLKAGALVVLLAVVTTLAAAALSLSEEWEGVRLSDGHTAAVRRAVFSPDGRRLVSCGEDAKVIVWDFARRERLATLADHTDRVCSIAFSPDGRWFAAGDYDGNLIVWDARRLERAAVLVGHQGPIGGLAFSPDGRLLASALGTRTIMWRAENWEKIRELPVGVSGHGSLLFSPDSRLLVAPHGFLWDITTGRQVARYDEEGVTWPALSPDAKRMVSIDPAGTVKFSEVNRFHDPARVKSTDHARVHRDHGRAAAFSPDSKLAATGAEDIILWDAATQTKLVRLEHTAIVWSLEFSPDGRWLVSTHGDGAILLWDVAERERVANFNEHSAGVRAVAFSRDGKQLASASEDRSVIIWDAEHGRKEALLIGHNTRVTAVAFSPDGKSVASCDQGGVVIFWDVARRQPRWTVKHPTEFPSYWLAISPDGRFVAATHGVYESAEGRQVVNLYDPWDQIYGVAFSADGRWLACANPMTGILLLDTGKWQLLDSVHLNNTSLITVSFSPDGQWLVTGEDQGTVRLWQTGPLRQVAIIGRHAARIKSVAFSPDGREVASAGDDQMLALWDVKKRRLITRIGTHTAPVLSVAWSPDGKRLAAGGHDKSVRVYTRHRTLRGRRLD
jgi:WD40 repeat protein